MVGHRQLAHLEEIPLCSGTSPDPAPSEIALVLYQPIQSANCRVGLQRDRSGLRIASRFRGDDRNDLPVVSPRDYRRRGTTTRSVSARHVALTRDRTLAAVALNDCRLEVLPQLDFPGLRAEPGAESGRLACCTLVRSYAYADTDGARQRSHRPIRSSRMW
jgi:hypothetical protein